MLSSSTLSSNAWPPFSKMLTPERTSGITSVLASRVCSSYLRAWKFFLAPSTSPPVDGTSKATSNADMYCVIAGSTSVRAAASRRPAELVIASLTRRAPNAVASNSGTSTIAKTFQRTGQLLSDQAGGRLACAAGAAGTSENSGGAAPTGGVGRVNMVTRLRPREQPRHWYLMLEKTRGS